jgi:MoaA/NifB/PqqE/SkfB family radical SAM enzyme
MKCGAFDSGLTIHPDGKVTPCCQLDMTYAKKIDQLDWDNPWDDLRDGRGCNACRQPGPVYRDTFDTHFNEKFAVRYLDVRNNNLCNMECVICSPYYSSKWADRIGNAQPFVNTKFDIDLSNVKRIYFAGGEPFLNKTHWEILKKIKNPKDIGLVYSSNLSYITGAKEYLSKFNDVFLNASLEGVGKFGEQMRPGLNWKKWQSNLESLLELPNIKIEIAVTVSLLNIWHLKDIEEYANSKNIKATFYRLDNPQYLSLSALPAELKEKITYLPSSDFDDLLEKDHSYLFEHSVANVLLGDRLRGTNLWDYLPFGDWAIKNILGS